MNSIGSNSNFIPFRNTEVKGHMDFDMPAAHPTAVETETSDSFSASSVDKTGQPSVSNEMKLSAGNVKSAEVKSAAGVAGVSESTLSTASKASDSAVKIAASCISGSAGAVAGVTIDELKEAKGEVEKGYHLPENFISGYYQRRIFPYQAHPTYTSSGDNHMYRGMYITVDELANILQNGFETKYNTWSAAGGKGIYLSSSIREADDYIFQSVDITKKNAIGVVFQLENGEYAKEVVDPVLNSTETIYKSEGDVPSSKITDIYLRGEYGLERLADIIEKAQNGDVKSNKWVNMFDGYMMR